MRDGRGGHVGGVRVEIEGVDDVIRDLRFRQVAARAGLVRGLFAAAHLIRSAAVRGIARGPKTGRRYGAHIASAEGEYPAADTGVLMGSITAGVDPTLLEGHVDAAAEYAAPLEFKPPERGGRPFLNRAFLENADKAQALVGAALAEALAGADRKARRS